MPELLTYTCEVTIYPPSRYPRPCGEPVAEHTTKLCAQHYDDHCRLR